MLFVFRLINGLHPKWKFLESHLRICLHGMETCFGEYASSPCLKPLSSCTNLMMPSATLHFFVLVLINASLGILVNPDFAHFVKLLVVISSFLDFYEKLWFRCRPLAQLFFLVVNH
jgi:hypothetical protein